MIGPFLMFIGLFLLFVTFKGKSEEFLTALGIDLPDFGQMWHDWMLQNIWNPFSQAITQGVQGILPSNPFGDTFQGPNQPASNDLVSHFTIALKGGGAMTVNASDYQAALDNVRAQGGTPADG